MFRIMFDDGWFARAAVEGDSEAGDGTTYAISRESSDPGAAAATKGTENGPPERR
jgi:hypothetical protein